MGTTYKFAFENGADGYFYAIYYGKVEAQLEKPEKNKAVNIEPKEVLNG